MRWLPYEIITLTIPQSPQMAAAQLSAIVESRNYFRFWKKHTIFEGEMDLDIFHIQRIITGRNSFIPQIDVQFEAQPEGTRVKITYVISPLAAACMLFWFGFTIFVGIATVFGVATQGTSAFALLIAPAFAAFGYLLMNSCFWPEVDKATQHLEFVWKKNPLGTSPPETTIRKSLDPQ